MDRLAKDYDIRFGGRLDIPALIAADRAASELFRSTGLIPDMSAIPESIPADIFADAISQGMLMVINSNNGPVGFALCRLQHKTLYLDQISVDPAHGRKGLGRWLLTHVFALAEEHKCASVTLSTFRDVPWNGPFYETLGFREIPRKRLTDWMLAIETAQAESLDITKRYFLQRPVRRSLLARLR